ncbi:exonuclease domain-containing protein [Jeotgalibaca caeni]|uniref:exonuclease domain-containing protein n=1 Tax=Jeotgalibaca caeni TaxID=3028623 RepID=UPI00237DA1B1|nr:exonuclease domain-containing protein [Jeotgalibaca caeni]MDE1549438.1 exonuclease domain-containing protein [Jeotgalibaca caeni]
MDFVAIDFETANNRGDSICSIGMSRFSDGKETDRYYRLINPMQSFSPGNIRVHGIYPDDVYDEPRFDELYPEIRAFIGDDPLVAHFAPFDMNCLQKSIETYRLPKMENEYFCSCAMAKKLLDLHSNSLVNVLDYYGLTIENHHNAMDDAAACGMIASKLLRPYDYEIEGFLEEHHYRMGKLFSHRFGSKKAAKSSTKKTPAIKPQGVSFDPEHPFYRKHVCFTGRMKSMKRQEAAQLVVNIGGFFDPQLAYETTYLVIADTDWKKIGTPSESRKMEAVREMLGSGHPLTVLSESDFKKLF